MAATVTVRQSPQHTPTSPNGFRLGRWWLLVPIGSAVGILVYITVLVLNWPFTQQALIDVLQERSVRSVTVDHFRRTYWPPGCVAEGISFLHRKHKNKPPLITISKLVIKSSYTGLIIHRSLSKVVAIGMHVTIPPSDPNGGPNPVMPLTQSNTPGPALVIGTVIADGAVLDFVSRDPGKKPFELVIDRLALDGVGNNRGLSYQARISNPEPPGEIKSRGVFGPWDADNPPMTPVDGYYTYRNANLAVFKDLSGTLSSSGKFTGRLAHMDVTGTADVPNFHLTGTSHTRRLSTQFHATVDATDGDTTLESVIARFDETTIAVKGGVVRRPGEKGKSVSLDMSSTNGRIEDLLNLFIAARRSPMTGSVSFRGHVEVPPSAGEFVKKLKLIGDFGVGSGEFSDKATQSTIDRLSAGNHHNRKAPTEDSETGLSDLSGHVVATNGIATLSRLSFRVPGATARMQGIYGLAQPYNVDLHGTLVTDHPADAATGFKSFLLKAMTPFLKKKGKEKIVPFKITGNYERTAIGLDLGGKK